MLLSLQYLVNRYNLHIKGVIHIGAHYGDEYFAYKELDIPYMLFIEPSSKAFEVLKSKVPVNENVELLNNACGNENKQIKLFVETSNNGQSNSVLEPDLHLQQYPSIQFDSHEMVDMVKLDDVITKKCYNFINIDIQGYELDALKGASEYLHNVDYIYSEVNRASLYKDCVMVEHLDLFLSGYNFTRVETSWLGDTWGDAIYIKNYSRVDL